MADEGASPPLEKPLPDPNTKGKRPGTSGTEMNLRANRQKASSAFQQAQRAEQAYRAKRRANNARRDMKAAREYYREGFNQLKLGTACSVRAVRAIPAVLREKRDNAREKSEVRKREKAAEKRRKWEEKAKGGEASEEPAAGAGAEAAAAE